MVGRCRAGAALLGLVIVRIIVAMTCVFDQLVQAQPHPVLASVGRIWNGLAVATWLSLVLTMVVGWGYLAAWRKSEGSRVGRIYNGLVLLAGLFWIAFVLYWDLFRPTW